MYYGLGDATADDDDNDGDDDDLNTIYQADESSSSSSSSSSPCNSTPGLQLFAVMPVLVGSLSLMDRPLP